jgi:hypothetical protein
MVMRRCDLNNVMKLRELYRFVLAVSIILVVNPPVSEALDQMRGFQGYYANKLKNSLDITNSRISENLKSYKKDKSAGHLEVCHIMIIQSVDEIESTLKTAVQQLQDTPDSAEMEKLNAQIDKLEIISIRDSEMPYLCGQLYEVGHFYVKSDKKKARQCFRDIVGKFTSYESRDCSTKAEKALENLKAGEIE